MKKNRWLLRAVVLVLFCGVMTTTVSLAAEAGSSGDPLVTLSYLNETFMDSIMGRRHRGGYLHSGDAVKRPDPHRRHRLRGDAPGGHGGVCVSLQSRPY